VADTENPVEGFEIDGKTYAVPTLDTFDLDEAEILERYSGVVLEDFAPIHPDASEKDKEAHANEQARMLSRATLKKAWAHIAYRRGNPDAEFEEVQKLVGKLNLVDVTLVLFAEEEDAGPPSLSESESERSTSPRSSLSDSGSPGLNGSDVQDDQPVATGTSESATSSPVSLVATSGN
jgi:hypothetical protein